MKLLRARFQNFRLLRDLEIKFSSGFEKKLTVIRAANESGKTTILHALQWALYGDTALPNRGKNFRLFPIDWDTSKNKEVPIKVEVEFEVNVYKSAATDTEDTRKRYRLIRSVVEHVDGSRVSRSNPDISLLELKKEGAAPILYPESTIKNELPTELREIFFTDGDRVLSFIEADIDQDKKRERVKNAIKSLLGISIIETTIRHVSKSENEINKKVRETDKNELGNVAAKLEDINKNIEHLESELLDTTKQLKVLDEEIEENEKEIEIILQKGDKEHLKNRIKNVKEKMENLDALIIEESRKHSKLFRHPSLAADLLPILFDRAFDKLDKLRNKRKMSYIPISILNERLSSKVCICGETLDTDTDDANDRVLHIQRLVEQNRNVDRIDPIIAQLYNYEPQKRQWMYQSNKRDDISSWKEEYQTILKHRMKLEEEREQIGREHQELEIEQDNLPDKDIKKLRENKKWKKNMRDNVFKKSIAMENDLSSKNEEQKELIERRDKLLREDKKNKYTLEELKIIKDTKIILQRSYEQIMTKELSKVSNLMNDIFIEMIGADSEQNTIICRSEINQDFDIIVYGPSNRKINPDRDLNGSSRRALTLAFILALTKISGVEAPNVIDTPLGMTSGYVRRSILKVAIRESAQLILFLTHDEIFGCEDIIDDAAGMVWTLTNPIHYPKILTHDPNTREHKVLQCRCDHRNTCILCARRSNQ